MTLFIENTNSFAQDDATAIADLLEAQGDFVEVKRLIGEVSQAKYDYNSDRTSLITWAEHKGREGVPSYIMAEQHPV